MVSEKVSQVRLTPGILGFEVEAHQNYVSLGTSENQCVLEPVVVELPQVLVEEYLEAERAANFILEMTYE
jgi:hypothetical protein